MLNFCFPTRSSSPRSATLAATSARSAPSRSGASSSTSGLSVRRKKKYPMYFAKQKIFLKKLYLLKLIAFFLCFFKYMAVLWYLNYLGKLWFYHTVCTGISKIPGQLHGFPVLQFMRNSTIRFFFAWPLLVVFSSLFGHSSVIAAKGSEAVKERKRGKNAGNFNEGAFYGNYGLLYSRCSSSINKKPNVLL